MKTRTKKLILVITAGALLLGAIGGGLGAILHQSDTVETLAAGGMGPNSVSVGDYYKDINPNSTTLLSDLRFLNNKYKSKDMGYDGLRSIYQYTDADPNGSGKILGFYDNKLIGPSWDSGKTWNREHVWPDSIGGGSVDGDAFMPRPTWVKSNSSRGNSYYAESGAFDPGYEIENYRGISARIIFYCMVVNGNLKLEDDTKKNPKTGSNTMGKLSDMLKWNLEYLPSSSSTAATELRCEYNRNDVVQHSYQGNRNPFVDHPEYACKIWGNYNSATKAICGSQPTEKTLTSITISGTLTKKNYYVNDTFNPSGLVITAHYSDNTTKNVTSSSDLTYTPTKFTEVNEYQTVTFSYTEGGVTRTATVSGITVRENVIHVTEVKLNAPDGFGLDVGETYQLSATVLPSTATNKTVTYSSTDPEVASVDRNTGLVTALSEGNATIIATAADNGVNKSCDVVVTEPYIPVTSISFSQTSITLEEGGSKTVVATVLPSNATEKDVTYISKNEDVAQVSNTGKITAISPGIAEVSAVSSNGLVVNLTVNVTQKEIPVQGVTLSQTEITVVETNSRTIEARIFPDNATNQSVIWTSEDEDVAVVNNGEITGVSSGTTTISVKTVDGNKTASCTVNVITEDKEVPLTSIAVSPTTVSLEENTTRKIDVTFTPEDATNKDLVWISSDDNVVTVRDGVISAHRPGTATITVRSVANSSISATTEVEVTGETYAPVDSISLDIISQTISVGGSVKINAQVNPENVYDDGIIWSTSDENVALVSNGKVVGVGEGEVQITATSHENPEIKATATILVIAKENYVSVEKISIDYTTKELTVGDDFTLKATVYPENATNKKVNWTVSDSSIISVDANGKVTALKAGTASVYVSSDESSFIRSVCQITVKEQSVVPDDATLVELVIGRLPNKTTYLVGETFVKDGLVINGHFSDGTVHDVTELCSFNIPSTAQEGISTVHAIYAQSGVSVSFDIVVSNKTLTGIQITKSPTKLEYFAGESLLNYGIEVVATYDDESTINVTDIVSYDIETFDTTGIIDVVVSYQEFIARFSVLVKEGAPTSQTKANDFALVFNYKTVDIDNNEISAQKWAMLKFYYSKLDEGSKEVLKNATYSKAGKTEVRAADPDQIEECVRDYDAMYLAHKGQDGFDDFMNRNPQPEARDNTSKIDPKIIFGIAIGAIVLIPLIIVIAVVTSRKRKAKYDK